MKLQWQVTGSKAELWPIVSGSIYQVIDRP